MRFSLSAAALAAVIGSAMACGDSGESAPAPSPVIDAGAPAPAPPLDAGAVVEPEPPSGPRLLKAGMAYALGVTSTGHVLAASASGLEMVPVDGGAPVRLPFAGGPADRFHVSGGAVAWWTELHDGFGTLSVWNATDGVTNEVSTRAFAGDGPANLFAASPDGRRIAYWEGESASTTNLHVLDLATGESSPADGALSPRFAIDVWSCEVTARFFGTKLITSYCDAGGTPRVFGVPGDDVLGVRIDPGFDGAQLRGWSADDAGNRLFLQAATDARAYLLDITDLRRVTSDSMSADEGYLTKDGAALVYRVGSEVRRLVGSTETPLASPVMRLWQVSGDGTRALVSDGQVQRVVDTTRTVPSRFITAATSAIPELTASGRHVVYKALAEDFASFSVTAKSINGGAPRALASGVVGSQLAPEGDGVVTFGKIDRTPGVIPAGELQYFDVGTGSTTVLGAKALPGFFVGKKVVFSKLEEPGAGIYLFDPG